MMILTDNKSVIYSFISMAIWYLLELITVSILNITYNIK